MGAMSLWHWLVVGLLVLVLFGGRGRISDAMGDVAKGITNFRKGLADAKDETRPTAEAGTQPPAAPKA